MTRDPTPVALLIGADFLYPMTNDGDIVMEGEVAVRGGQILSAGPQSEVASILLQNSVLRVV